MYNLLYTAVCVVVSLFVCCCMHRCAWCTVLCVALHAIYYVMHRVLLCIMCYLLFRLSCFSLRCIVRYYVIHVPLLSMMFVMSYVMTHSALFFDDIVRCTCCCVPYTCVCVV